MPVISGCALEALEYFGLCYSDIFYLVPCIRFSLYMSFGFDSFCRDRVVLKEEGPVEYL